MPPAVNRRGQLQAASRLSTLNDKELLQRSPAFSPETQIRHFNYSSHGCLSMLLMPISDWVISVKFKQRWHLTEESHSTWKNNQRQERCHTSILTISNLKDLSAWSCTFNYGALCSFLWLYCMCWTNQDNLGIKVWIKKNTTARFMASFRFMHLSTKWSWAALPL